MFSEMRFSAQIFPMPGDDPRISERSSENRNKNGGIRNEFPAFGTHFPISGHRFPGLGTNLASITAKLPKFRISEFRKNISDVSAIFSEMRFVFTFSRPARKTWPSLLYAQHYGRYKTPIKNSQFYGFDRYTT